MKLKTAVTIVIGITLVVTTTAWCGQGGGRHGMGMRHGFMGQRLLASLDLSDEQRDAIDTIRDSYAPLFDELHEQLKTMRQQAALQWLTDAFDEAAIRQACQDAAVIHEDLAVLKGKMIVEIKSVLTDEQIAELKERIQAHMEAMETPDS